MINVHKIKNAAGIHNGAVIHHQDQSIVLVNFNIKNTKNNKVPEQLTFTVELFFIV